MSGREPKPVRGADRGFTLLELIVVLVIISVMMAVAAPRMAGRGQAAALRGAGYDLQTLANTARARAVLSGYPVDLLLGADGRLRLLTQGPGKRVTAESDTAAGLLPSRRLPNGMSVRFEPDGDGDAGRIRFRSDGSAEGGELLLSDSRDGELRFRLIEPMGRLQLAHAS